MAVPKTKQQKLLVCEKCGSLMITRLIAQKNGEKNKIAKLVKIQQCIVCRHWKPLV
ncbi:MAG: hypothetical protein ACTSQJ_15100 [Promethearchaeota archaeon]